MLNANQEVIDGFGDEWSRFDQSALNENELRYVFDQYFAIFPWGALPEAPVGADIGCGSGRWATLVAPRVGKLHLIDASQEALGIARTKLKDNSNCEFHCASVGEIPLESESVDFAYSLGVLHHVPDTSAAISACAQLLKPGAPLLLYLYYRFDDRPMWFRALWQVSNGLRVLVSRLPNSLRYGVSQVMAAFVYWPLARTAQVLKRSGRAAEAFPLSFYSDKSFYVMRTDALDRFGTRLEKRFTKEEICHMLKDAGLVDVRFSAGAPYWCVVARKPEMGQSYRATPDE